MTGLSDRDRASFETFERQGWERAAGQYHDHWGNLACQSVGSMLDAANITAGSDVLDVATGAGYLAAAAAARGASVTGLDFAASQVELATSLCPDARFVQGSADDLPFPDANFDAVVMGFGMNHLPSPEAAAEEAFRVLRPGGFFAFTVWSAPRAGEAFGIVLDAIAEAGGDDSRLPPAPPYFRFADSGEAAALLENAGFRDVSTRQVQQIWRHDTPDQLFAAFNEGAVRATAMLRSQTDEVREAIRFAVRAVVEEMHDGQHFVIPAPATMTVGRK